MIRLVLIVLALASPAFAQTSASCLQTPGTVCKTGDTMTGPLALHAAVLTPTGTIAYTSPGNTIIGTSTHFTTELAIGDAISPTTAGGVYFVLAITNDTSMTVNPAPLASWTTQAWTYARPLTVWQNMLGQDRIKFLAGGAAFFNATSPQGYFTFAAPISPSGTLTTIHTTGAAGASGSGSTNGTGGSAALTIVNGAGGNFTSGTGHQGGAGAGVLFSGGSGGNITATDTGAGNTGGGGGAFTVRGGSGGQVTAGTGNTGGTGAQAALIGGTGGSAIASNTNGNGGAVLIDGGVAGAGAGSAGSLGDINFGTQNFAYTNVGAAVGLGGVIAPAQITANLDDYNPTNLARASTLLLDLDADHSLTGIQGGRAGRLLVLVNTSAFDLTLQNDTTSTAANRFLWGAAYKLAAKESVILVYDGTNSRWRIAAPYGIRTMSPTTNRATNGLELSQSGFNVAAILDEAIKFLASGNFTTLGMVSHRANDALSTDWAARTITGTAPVTVSNGDGIAGNPTIALDPLVTRLWLPAAGCINTSATSNWDLPGAAGASPACVAGTNQLKGVLDFADTLGGFGAFQTLALPVDWSTGTLPDVALYWTTTATTGNAKWTVRFVCTDVAATATDDPAFPASGNGFNTVTTAAPGTTERVQTSLITGATLPSSCVTGTRELLHILVFRDGNDAADTIAATARLIGVELSFRHAA